MSTREPRAPESALEPAGGAPDPWWRRLHARNRALPPAQAGTMRGAVWTVFVAVEFYLFSNPLVFIPWFEWSLNTALEIALLFLLVQVPWLRLRPPPPTVLLFVAFITLSVVWSQLPEVTWINIRIYVAVAVVAWLISVNVSPRVMAYGLLLGGVLVVVLSLYAVHENLPGAAVADGGSGYMAGVGTNRNILAYVLATVCAAVAMPPRRPLGWLVWAPSVGVVLIGLSLAGSATGGIAAAAAFVTVAVLVGDEWARRHRSRAGRRGLWMASLAVLGLVAWRTNDIAAVLGRETSTFSGRLPIWEAAWQATQPQLWQGFGWGAVWPHPWVPAPPNRVMDVIWFATDDPYYYPPHGHSSLFDLLPQVGLIGVVLAALIHIEALARAVSARRAVPADPEDVAAGRMVILLLVVLLVFGLSEPLTTIPFGWFLLIMACGVLPLRRPEHRPRPRRRLDSGRRRLVVPAMGRWVR